MPSGLVSNGNELCAQRPVVFLILDGVGVGRHDDFDAVARANTPTLDWLCGQYASHTRQLRAHGVAVGLPSDGDMGNSEVGHNILGAGRVFDQGAKCVETAIASGSIWEGVWSEMLQSLGSSDGTLHFLGLLSDGNVHSHDAHLRAMLERAASEGVRRVRVHVLFDGRDVPECTAERYLDRLEKTLAEINANGDRDYRVASGGGRMTITMDRYEADWEMVERGWKAHVLGDAPQFPSAAAALANARDHDSPESDQTIPAFVVVDDGKPVGTIEDGDAVVLFNFRGDRAIEISRAFQDGADFNGFDRVRQPKVFFAGMMLYDGDAQIPERYLVEPESVQGSISELLADRGVTQFACAETQKYGHVTYFWN
ncbi:MAG: 2,3-bisphosphoglycerate-independent phosphoglycerate mutase, partial [Gammaproteobacteria bacterium]|nr:2,3-bisphosphoglycerate-independent phosphoglycerate mutase [Gammaproteobacteria bacterium]